MLHQYSGKAVATGVQQFSQTPIRDIQTGRKYFIFNVPNRLAIGPNGDQTDYASGLSLGKYRGLSTVDHAGGDAGYRSDMTRFPEHHFSAAVLCNSSDTDPTSLVRKVADIYLAREMNSGLPASTEPSAAIDLTVQQLSRMLACIGIARTISS